MVLSRHSQFGSPDLPAEWQHSAPSSLLFLGPLQVPEFQHLDIEATPLQLAPTASIRSQALEIQPFVEGLQQGLADQAEELARRIEGTKRRFRNLARGLREGLQKGGSRLGLVHMQTEHKSCSEHDYVGNRGLLLASISESTNIPRRRKSQSSADDGTGKKIQLVSSTTVAKKEFTVQDLLIGAIAGGAAGLSVETALYPIDTIKTRLQVLSKGGSLSFKGLYSGLSGNLAGVLPASALFVAIYEPVKLHLLDRFPERWSSAAQLLAAAAGATGASVVRVPTEVIKSRMQTGQFTSAAGAVKQILAKEGIRGMYAGYTSFLLRDLPFDAIEFVAYEQIKLAVQAATKRKELTAAETAFAGALAGAVTGAVTTPLDVIKTRLMVQGTNIKYTGIMDCISKTVAEEGASALFKGVGPRVLWIGIGGSIFFGVLEKTKSLLNAKLEARKAAKPATVV